MKCFRLILLCMLAMSLASCKKMALDIIQELMPKPTREMVGQTDYTIYGTNVKTITYHYVHHHQTGGITTTFDFGQGLYLDSESKKAAFQTESPCVFDFRSDTSFFLINHRYRFDEVIFYNMKNHFGYYDLPNPYEFSPHLSTFEFGVVEGFSYTLYFDLLFSRPDVDSTKTTGDTLKISGSVTHFRNRETLLH